MTVLEFLKSVDEDTLVEKIASVNNTFSEVFDCAAFDCTSECFEKHQDCEFLDDYYDCECPEYYGICMGDYKESNFVCPYGINREEVFKKHIREWLHKEIKDFGS